MKYRIVVTRVEPHPKAGEAIPISGTGHWNGYNQTQGVFPQTIDVQCLLVELSDAEYAAVKKACIEAA